MHSATAPQNEQNLGTDVVRIPLFDKALSYLCELKLLIKDHL